MIFKDFKCMNNNRLFIHNNKLLWKISTFESTTNSTGKYNCNIHVISIYLLF